MGGLERNSGTGLQDKIVDIKSQQENDIFLKHNESDYSSGIAIRENQIDMQVRDGKCGIVIRENGEIDMQGKIVNNSFPGYKETMHPILGKTTENVLSFLPSTWLTEIPGMLFSAPNLGIVRGITDILSKFLQIPTGGK